MSTFDISFDRIFTNEGRFQKNYNDRGNWTTGIIGKGELKGQWRIHLIIIGGTR